MNTKQQYYLIVLLWAVLFCSASAAVQAQTTEIVPQHILALHALPSGSAANQINAGFLRTLQAKRPNDLVSLEYMDAVNHPEQEKFNNFKQYLAGKYHNKNIQTIIVFDGILEELAIQLKQEVFPTAKIIGGRFHSTAPLKPLLPGIDTYIYFDLGVADTFRQMLVFQPELRKVLVVADGSKSGRDLADYARREWAALGVANVTLTVTEQDDIESVLQQIAGLQEQDAILFMNFRIDSQQRLYDNAAWQKLLAEYNKAPVYELLKGVYYGLPVDGSPSRHIGGFLFNVELVGAEFAKAALLIGNGQVLPAKIEAAEAVEPVFDYQGMKQFNFDIKRLPQAAAVINKPFSFIETYWRLVAGTAVTFLILLAALGLTLVMMRRQKQAEQKLLLANYELTALYEEITATEEELRVQYEKKEHNERQLKQLYERYQLAMEGANDVIWDFNWSSGRIFTSPRIELVFGIPFDEHGYDYKRVLGFIPEEDRDSLRKALREHLDRCTPYCYVEFRIFSGEEREMWAALRGKAQWNEQGKVIRIAGSMTDITAQKKAREQMEYLAYYDALTNLPNRVLFYAQLGDYLGLCEEEHVPLAFFLADIDDFKMMNDVHGHHLGDLLLKQVADALQPLLGERSYAARFGGDEFIFFLYGCTEQAEAEEFAEKIKTCVAGPHLIQQQTFTLSASIGISLYPRDGDGFEELLQCADLALYRVKGSRKGTYMFFEKHMHVQLSQQAAVETGMREGLAAGQFSLVYQPKIDLRTGELDGVEALLRWQHPQRGSISPAEFIPLAEKSGFIITLGEWVTTEACKFIRQLSLDRGVPLRVAVNISPLQLEEADFVQMVTRAIDSSQLLPQQLEIEITETMLLKNFVQASEKINALRQYGVTVAMDDFGTGYSSLTYLQKLPIDILKIDRDFVIHLGDDDKARSLIASIVDLSHVFGFKVVAEGIEEGKHLDLLKDMGCDCGQGYYISRPLTPEAFIQWLGQRDLKPVEKKDKNA